MRDKKKIVIGVLCALVGIMAVGYAALATRLNITGTASIDSTWKVEITNITESNIVGDATSKETPSYTATTANFSVGLIQPTDSITYDIEISNLGTLKAKVDSIQVVMDENDAITYTTEGLAEGDTLGVNEKDILSVTVAYNPAVTSQPSVTAKDITITINYVQDLGDTGTIVPTGTYSIGDTVSFAGSDWYVIKDSTSEEDYVTLMKATVLTNSELGDYGIDYICSENDAANGTNGCTATGETVELNTMSYYWSDTCHYAGTYGYTTGNSACGDSLPYSSSKVKEFLEGTYINTLGSDNLTEVDGYKVRLVTLDELLGDLGYSMDITSGGIGEFPIANDNVPTWIYENFGENPNGVDGYWTMTQKSIESSADLANPIIWAPTRFDGMLRRYNIYSASMGVRPVINLLKSSI